jgi:hypothetical protein
MKSASNFTLRIYAINRNLTEIRFYSKINKSYLDGRGKPKFRYEQSDKDAIKISLKSMLGKYNIY